MPDISTYNNLKLNFWAITKCGNTTVKTHLYNLNNNTVFNHKKQTKIHSKEFLSYIDKDNASKNGFINFTVVRNPYDRFLSMYKDLVLSRPKRGLSAGLKSNTTVDEMLSFIESIPNESRDVHFKTQISFIDVNLDIKVIDLKNLSNWQLNIPAPETTRHKSKSNFNNLTEIQKEKIYKIYKEDFIRFNYQK